MDEEIAGLIRAGGMAVRTIDESGWFDQLDRRRADVDPAVAESLDAGDLDALVELGAALWPYWVRRAADGWDWLDRLNAASAAAPPSTALAELRYEAGLSAYGHG